jgi:hypothetical protein
MARKLLNLIANIALLGVALTVFMPAGVALGLYMFVYRYLMKHKSPFFKIL